MLKAVLESNPNLDVFVGGVPEIGVPDKHPETFKLLFKHGALTEHKLRALATYAVLIVWAASPNMDLLQMMEPHLAGKIDVWEQFANVIGSPDRRHLKPRTRWAIADTLRSVYGGPPPSNSARTQRVLNILRRVLGTEFTSMLVGSTPATDASRFKPNTVAARLVKRRRTG
jgi:hypothetical protein